MPLHPRALYTDTDSLIYIFYKVDQAVCIRVDGFGLGYKNESLMQTLRADDL